MIFLRAVISIDSFDTTARDTFRVTRAERRDAGHRAPSRHAMRRSAARAGRAVRIGWRLSFPIDKECIMSGTVTSTAGNVAASGSGAAGSGISTDAITSQIAANAQQGLEIAQAQSQASVKQAAGEALKSGASGLKDAAKAS
jgi:hypothetical protein